MFRTHLFSSPYQDWLQAPEQVVCFLSTDANSPPRVLESLDLSWEPISGRTARLYHVHLESHPLPELQSLFPALLSLCLISAPTSSLYNQPIWYVYCEIPQILFGRSKSNLKNLTRTLTSVDSNDDTDTAFKNIKNANRPLYVSPGRSVVYRERRCFVSRHAGDYVLDDTFD